MASKHDASLRAVLSAIASNTAVTLAKFGGWAWTLSPSMFAEAIHSLADTMNQLLLYIGIQHAQGKPSKMYPLGKGSARYVWNLVSAIGLFFLGFGITVYHGVITLVEPSRLEDVRHDWLPLSILAVSFILEGFSLLVAIQSVNATRGERGFWDFVKRGDDPTISAVLLEDAIAVIGVVVAFICILISKLTHNSTPDAIGSIIIGCLLGIMAIILGVANGRILMGISADPDAESEIREFLEAHPSVERVVSLKTEVMAPGKLRLSLEVEFHGGILISRQQIERDADRIREGEDPLPVLFETADRMVRTVGREINLLEIELHRRFPEIQYIDLEVN